MTKLTPTKKIVQEGEKLGDYTLLRLLGQGAIGATYLAEHRFLKKPFVLKVLDRDLCQMADFIPRFEREMAIVAALDHPNIVKVHNVCESEGYHFLVADAVVDETGEPCNLHDYLKQRGGRLPEEEIVQILKQVGAALDYCHEKGGGEDPFAHRSLKPSNVLIVKKKPTLQIKLSDFGLSRVLGSSLYMSKIYEAIASKIGEPLESLPEKELSFIHHYLFLAPEQRWQKTLSSGIKSDVYAFGVLMYFLLTTHYPEGAFEPLATASPQFKLPWDRIIRRCLVPDPVKRADQIQKLLLELSVTAPSAPTETQTIHFKPILTPPTLQKPEHPSDPNLSLQKEPAVGKPTLPQTAKGEAIPLLTEMAIIHGGDFERGSYEGGRDEMPRHQITLDPYAIDIHPVTNRQFARFLEEMGGEKDQNNNDIIRLRESRIRRMNGKISTESGYATHPVVGVTWYGADAYAKWVGKRLPTEAEWEIAAYGGARNQAYPTGQEVDKTRANFFSSDTTPVMSYPANGYGIYDMAGNVYEWCYDWYDHHYYELSIQEPHNPQGPLQGVYRVLRGGCWKSLKEDLRCSHRHRNNPGTVNGTYGFRCAANVLPTK